MKPVLIAPPYSGPTAVCRTCGHHGATTKRVSKSGLESLLRTCGRCGLDWTERPTTPSTTFGFDARKEQ